MILVITEKPSVAMDIAHVLGSPKKHNGYYQSDNYIISWCIGHLIALAPSEVYDTKYKKWSLDDLPIVPEEFKYIVQNETKEQYDIISTLLSRNDVEYIINACDAGREGELIFRLVYNFAKSNKPIKRLWLTSMENESIKKEFANLKDSEKYVNLYKSALCRQQADWLIGINGTRYFSCTYNSKLNVGRVMTPTLAMIVKRHEEIKAFQPIPFYRLYLMLDDVYFKSKKYYDTMEVFSKLLKCRRHQTLTITKVINTQKKQHPPPLHNLSSLQQEANKTFGLTASETLKTTQELYERKLCTYPRTESKYLPLDMTNTVKEIVPLCVNLLKINQPIPNNIEFVINDDKVTDHHAIIPTKNIGSYPIGNLTTVQKSILMLIMHRLVCAVASSRISNYTEVTAECAEERFKATNNVLIDNGYKDYIKSKTVKKEKSIPFPNFANGENFNFTHSGIHTGETTAPLPYTDASILSAMEDATEQLEDGTSVSGNIGTASTRASIIDKLIKEKFIKRKGENKVKYFEPTENGINLIKVLPKSMTSIETTIQWEEELKKIEVGETLSQDFESDIIRSLDDIISTPAQVSDITFTNGNEAIGFCPRCGERVEEYGKSFSCVSKACNFVLWKETNLLKSIHKKLTSTSAINLLETGKTKLTDCISNKTGKKYSCTLVLEDTGNYINYKLEFPKLHKPYNY